MAQKLKDKRWSWYHIHRADGTRLSTHPVRGTSDRQALGNFFRGTEWPEGVYARRIKSMNVRSAPREDHVNTVVERTINIEQEVTPERSLADAEQLAFPL